MDPETATRNDQALRLATAVGRLRTVLRDVRWQVTDLSLTQVAILRQLERVGPSTASALAAAEHISPQAVAQQLVGLKARGYIAAAPDTNDGRKTSISLSRDGQRLLDALIESREAVLAPSGNLDDLEEDHLAPGWRQAVATPEYWHGTSPISGSAVSRGLSPLGALIWRGKGDERGR